MIVSTAGHDIIAARLDRLGQHLGILDDSAGVGLELWLQRFFESHRLGGDDVHQRAALHAREHGGIEFLGERFVVAQDQAAAWAAQGFVRRRRCHVGVRHGRRVHATGNEPGKVRHIDQ